MAMQAVDDNSRLEQHNFYQNMTTLVKLARQGEYHRATINLIEIIEHLDPFSPNIKEQSEAINLVNAMLHESAMAGHDPTLAAKNKTWSVAPNVATTSVSCEVSFEHNKRKMLSSAVLFMDRSIPAFCLSVCKSD